MCSTCFNQNNWTGSLHTGALIGADNPERQMIGGTTQGSSGFATVDGIIKGVRWDAMTPTFTSAVPVTYNFADSAARYGSVANYGDDAPNYNFAQLTTSMQNTARIAFGLISSFTNLEFSELAASTPGTSVDIAFGQNTDPDFPTASAYSPGSTQAAGDVWFHRGVNYQTAGNQYDNPVLGDYNFLTFLHEIGHAIGLKHSHEGGGIAGAVASARDSMEFTVMSYRSYIGASTVGVYQNEEYGFAQSYMMLDIAALQSMYGADFGLNATDSTYTFNASTGEMLINGVSQGDPGGSKIFRTVWDGGGIDTYDLSSYSNNQSVSLAAGSWSMFSSAQRANLGDGNIARANVFNALQYQSDERSLIENAITGSGDDRVSGNQIANSLSGGAGADILIGQGGNDTLIGGIGNDKLFGDFETYVAPAAPYSLGSGTMVLAAGTARNTAATAINLASNFSFAANSDIANATTIAHTTVNATANGSGDWYKVTLNAGNSLYIDIDNTLAPAGAQPFDSFVHVVGPNGTDQLVFGDDSPVDSGSNTTLDSKLTYVAPTTGTYYVVVDSFRFENQTSTGAAIAAGTTYILNLSIENPTVAPENSAPVGVAGNDILDGGAGNDTLDGGAGDDLIYYDAADTAANVTGGSGTDTLYVVGGSAPTSFNLVAQGFENALVDQADSTGQTWSLFRFGYDSAWRLNYRDIYFDNNTRWVQNFDELSNQTWSELRDVYTAVNGYDYQDTYFDSGARWLRNFDDLNNQVWSELRDVYTTTGGYDYQDVYLKDGTRWVRNFDEVGNQTYSEQRDVYTAASLYDYQDIYNKDGTRVLRDFDQANTFAWNEHRITYNAAGAIVSDVYL